MKHRYTTLLYLFFLLIFIGGLGMLFLRQSFVDYLRENTGITTVEVPLRPATPPEQLIDVEILKNEKLTSMRNNVQVFNFNEICGESVNAGKRCVLGNRNPFSPN